MPTQILIGEDDDEARTMLQRFLEDKGHVVRAVADGQAVVDELTRDVFDIVILDGMMPRLSGFEALRQLREMGDPTPVIIASAVSHPDDVVNALELGADDYVTKPFNLGVLLARIRLQLRNRGHAEFVEIAQPQPPAELADVSVEIDVETAAPASALALPPPAQPPPALPPPAPPTETVAVLAGSVISAEDTAADAGVLAFLRGAAGRLRRKPVTAELVPGSTLADRYSIEERIGSGGFGTVFRGRHLDMDRAVAIKVLHAGAHGDAVDVFRREAKNASRVHHANAVRVYDFGVLQSGCAYLVMELLEGPTLEDVLARESPVPIARAAEIMRPVLGALAYAHKQGIVHRDVKPGNIVLHREDDREVPKLLDFGIATHVDASTDDSGVVCGSPAYLAPERYRGASPDGRSDVYACGVVLYRLLTGTFPFDIAPDEVERLAIAHLTMMPVAPSTKNPALSSYVDELVDAMLAKDLAKRPNAADAASIVESLAWD